MKGDPHLERRLILEERQTVPDSMGGVVTSWVELGTLWAGVVARTGREGVVADRETSLGTFRILVRGAPVGAPSRPRPDQRFREGTRIYNILAVTEADPHGRFLVCFAEEGLRPYAPAHLGAERIAGGSVIVSWIRRTRIDGDAWGATEVPLGETSELYVVQVKDGSTLLREETVTGPEFDYTTTMQAADGAPAVVTFEVAQISERFGAGSIARIDFDG